MIVSRSALYVSVFLLSATAASGQSWYEEAVRYESNHPYDNGDARTLFRIEKRGATAMRVYFETLEMEQGWDFVELLNGSGQKVQRLTGRRTAFWSDVVQGSVIDLRVQSDNATNAYGFLATRIAYQGRASAQPASIEVRYNGNPVRSDSVLVLAPYGQPGDQLDLDVVGYTSSGAPTTDLDFRPALRAATGEAVATVEKIGATRVRLRAGRGSGLEVPVQLYDVDRPQLAAKFLVTIRQAQPSLADVELRYQGNVVQHEDCLILRPAGAQGSYLDLEIRAYGPSDEVLDPAAFEPTIYSPWSESPVSIERIAAGTLRLHAGRNLVARSAVTIRDRNRTEIGAQFLVTIEAAGPPPSQAVEIRFLIPDGAGGGRYLAPGEVIELSVHDGGEDHIPFAVHAIDRRGRVIDPARVDLAVTLSVPGWFGSLEAAGGNEFVFHSGARASDDIAVAAVDRSNNNVHAAMLIQTYRPGAGHDHGHDGHHDDPDPGPVVPPPIPTRWVQFGDPQRIPSWASSKNYFEFTYGNPNGSITIQHKVRITMSGGGKADLVRLEFTDGSTRDLVTNVSIPGDKALVIDVPPDVQNKQTTQIFAKVRGGKNVEVVCHVLTPQ